MVRRQIERRTLLFGPSPLMSGLGHGGACAAHCSARKHARMAAAMTVRLASFNVENFFAPPNALNVLDWDEGQPILAAYAEFNALIQKAVYAPADKARMIELLLLLDVYRAKNGIVHRNRVITPRWAWLRANRGTFDVDHEQTGIEIVAGGRSNWIGWLELAT